MPSPEYIPKCIHNIFPRGTQMIFIKSVRSVLFPFVCFRKLVVSKLVGERGKGVVCFIVTYFTVPYLSTYVALSVFIFILLGVQKLFYIGHI